MSRFTDFAARVLVGTGLAVQRATPPTQTARVALTPVASTDQIDVPRAWTDAIFGPGAPVMPLTSNQRREIEESEPRSFDYLPNVNSTIAPRAAYGLTPFATLKQLAEGVPECALVRRMIMTQLKSFVPCIKDGNGDIVQKARARQVDYKDEMGVLRKRTEFLGDNEGALPGFEWMTTAPDGKTIWPVWLSRFGYNLEAYDASCLYRMRNDKGKIAGLRTIDGSTIFALIDEHGSEPDPPNPAYIQIIKGLPHMVFTKQQLWYRPTQLRADAPYGISWIEDAMSAVLFLQNWWNYESSWYIEGNMAEGYIILPKDFTPEQALAWERNHNARMAGNQRERRRAVVLPYGTQFIDAKRRGGGGVEKEDTTYQKAYDMVSLMAGLPMSERGYTPNAGLGGSGYMASGENAFFRQGTSPRIAHIAGAFNEVLQESGLGDYSWQLLPPEIAIDPEKTEGRQAKLWQANVVRRNEIRTKVGLDPVSDDEDVYYSESTAQAAPTAPPAQPPHTEPPIKNAALLIAKHCGVCAEDEIFYGAEVVAPVRIPLEQGRNGSLIVAMRSDGQTAPALFKPSNAESKNMDDYIGAPMYPREEAAYILDRALGWFLVPVAYVSELDGVKGAVTYYTAHSEPRKPAGQYNVEWTERAACFDFVIGQQDRLSRNWSTHPDDSARPILYDNGFSFPAKALPQSSISTFVEFYRGRTISQFTLLALQAASREENGWWSDVKNLVGEPALNLALERLRLIIANRMIPIV